MLAVHVHIRVLPDQIDAFLAASRANAEASRQEPGVLRFDVLQDEADATHVVLVEVYRDDHDAPAAHKATAHYAAWRDAVAPMMAQPRRAERFSPVSPTDEAAWLSRAS